MSSHYENCEVCPGLGHADCSWPNCPHAGKPTKTTDFQPGDLVQFKSGGPVMTVSSTTGDLVTTCWWEATTGGNWASQPSIAEFLRDLLTRIDLVAEVKALKERAKAKLATEKLADD